MKIIEAIKLIYPQIEGGFSYWKTKYDGSEWENASDGLKWENPQFEKPSWDLILAKEAIVKLNEAKKTKCEKINSQRDSNISKNVAHEVQGQTYSFQRSITSQLAWVNAVESMEDIALENWVTADNQIISLSKQDLISICRHIRLRDTTETIQARKRKDAVNALSSIEEVESFDITQIYD